MNIKYIRWTLDRINHITRHGISPKEVEEAAFDNYNVVQTLKKPREIPGRGFIVCLVELATASFSCSSSSMKGGELPIPLRQER